ncbi:hypothetical protein KCP73_01895 [Salmonella enterica subsp. enterica]|nr:hypothetical protein KCP73_01895 [Salmonella enterica subsp. enterica]
MLRVARRKVVPPSGRGRYPTRCIIDKGVAGLFGAAFYRQMRGWHTDKNRRAQSCARSSNLKWFRALKIVGKACGAWKYFVRYGGPEARGGWHTFHTAGEVCCAHAVYAFGTGDASMFCSVSDD